MVGSGFKQWLYVAQNIVPHYNTNSIRNGIRIMNKSVIKLLNKKFIISVITSSTFITGCTMAVIWFYLSNIDRLDIFFDAVSLSSALGIIFVFIIVSVSGFSLVIFISSFILMLIYTGHEDNFKDYSSMPHRISIVCYLEWHRGNLLR